MANVNDGGLHPGLGSAKAGGAPPHGVQLPDLFEALPPEEAQREFQRELAVMRALCLKLVEDQRLVAS